MYGKAGNGKLKRKAETESGNGKRKNYTLFFWEQLEKQDVDCGLWTRTVDADVDTEIRIIVMHTGVVSHLKLNPRP